jgi:F0F1-type ATP synthase epsilon subunit
MYGIKKVKGGFAVVNPNSAHVFSNHALTKKQANKQRVAIALSESRKTGKPVKSFFVK